MTDAERNALYTCGLFSGMTPSQTDALLHCVGGGVAVYEKNALLWQMGQRVSACAVVLSGSVRAETVSADGGKTVVAWHGAGALVGDILMAGGESPVYVIAAEPTSVLLLPFSAVMGGCEKCCPAHRQLRENLMREIAQKYWAQRRRLDYLSVPSLRGRIARFLLDKAPGDNPFSLGLSREGMADFLCVNRSALSRELGRMEREGLLDFYRDTFQIRNRPALVGLAQG